jgi:hypothetical protein
MVCQKTQWDAWSGALYNHYEFSLKWRHELWAVGAEYRTVWNFFWCGLFLFSFRCPQERT